MSGAFPVTQSSLVYNEEDHKYYKYLYGEPQCDAVTGEQMAFDNVIIQEAKFKYVGNHGYVDLDTISRGRNAYVLTEGRCVPAHWWRKDIHKHTTYYYKDKSRIHLNTGKTMIFIIRDHRILSLTELPTRQRRSSHPCMVRQNGTIRSISGLTRF